MSEQPQGPGWWQASDGKYYPPQSAPAPPPPGPATAEQATTYSPTNLNEQPPKKPIYKRWWFWLLAILVVLVIIIVATSGGGDDAETGADEATTEQEATEEPAEEAAEEPAEEAAEEPAEEPAEDEAADAGTRDNPLAIGETATVGDYDVTIDSVNTDANQIVADANEFNEPPEQGQYVVVTMTVTFLGNESEEGDPWFDLTPTIVANNAQYTPGDNFAVAPSPTGTDVPTLEAGGTATYNEVFDVPTVDGAVMFVEETLSFDDTRVYWAVQ